MKHGPNALIDENLPVVVIATRDPNSAESKILYEKTLSNVQEVKAREGIVVALVTQGDEEARKTADHVIEIPPTSRIARADSGDRAACSCWRITLPSAAAATSISRAIWRRASPSNRSKTRTRCNCAAAPSRWRDAERAISRSVARSSAISIRRPQVLV